MWSADHEFPRFNSESFRTSASIRKLSDVSVYWSEVQNSRLNFVSACLSVDSWLIYVRLLHD